MRRITPKQLHNRVMYWAEHLPSLGLAHWNATVVIVEAPNDNPDSAACVECMDDYDYCTMQFKRSFLEANADEDSWDEIDKVIIHEWLHVLFRDYDNTIESIHSHLNTPVRALWSIQCLHELEGVIERMTLALWSQIN